MPSTPGCSQKTGTIRRYARSWTSSPGTPPEATPSMSSSVIWIGIPVAARRSRLRLVDRHVARGRERVALFTDGVEQVLALEDVDDLQVLGRRAVGVGDAVVVEHQLRVGEVLLRQPEGVEDPVPAGAVGAVGAAERPRVVAARVAVAALVGGVRAVRRVVQRFVDDLQPLDVRVAQGDGREPLLDLDQLLLGAQCRHPRRLLVAPDEHVEVKRPAVGLREVVCLIEVGPAHRGGTAGARRAAPLARVLGGDLVEVLREQRSGELVHIPEELVLAVQRERLLRGCGGRRERQADDRCNGRGAHPSSTSPAHRRSSRKTGRIHRLSLLDLDTDGANNTGKVVAPNEP